MHRVLADHHERARRDDVLADFEIPDRATHDPPSGRVDAHGLGQHAFRVGQTFDVVERGRATACQNLVQLRVQLRFDLRVFGEQIPSPHQRRRYRVVTGDEECHRLVPDLLGGQPLAAAAFILREQEHGEKVAVVSACASALFDDLQDDAAQSIFAAHDQTHRGQRQTFEQRGEWKSESPVTRQRVPHRLSDLVVLRLNVGAEERLADD